MSVDALRVWEQLEEECCEAVNYYSREYSSISPDKKRIKVILEQGAADFDQKYCPDDMGEKEHYRADYYVHGYMGMHLKQNFAALKYCFKDRIRQPLLFVDFGCGPMTSGLALAQVLSNGYKAETSYFGIDASRHMVKKAKYINEKYKLFSPECFKVVQGTQFDPQKIPPSFPEPQNVVLCLSFALAPNTLRPDVQTKNTAGKLADTWKKYIANQTQCCETGIIYFNPVNYYGNLHSNWLDVFRDTILDPNNAGGFSYSLSPGKLTEVDARPKSIALQTIRGTRK